MSVSRTWQDQSLMTAAHPGGEDFVEAVARSDRQLAELVLAGDETAFEEIFDRHKRLVASIAARYFRRPEQVEEIIQICFTKMYLELPNFRGLHELSLAGWLSKITRNACIDALRNSKRRPEDLNCDLTDTERTDLLAFAASDECAEQHHIDRDLADKLLSTIAADDRVLLQMLHIEGLSIAESAEALHWSVPKTKLRAWRARNNL
ncbi:MAG TPA: sigma-70 family RNA polymerase sigma factor, partial [Pyrinomonadaceae bacterium]|nr:sigma-70 family RNA polymerase sigma factor [Pyrinomonadaceae bacterium]